MFFDLSKTAIIKVTGLKYLPSIKTSQKITEFIIFDHTSMGKCYLILIFFNQLMSDV